MEVVSQDLVCEFTNIGLGIGFAFEKLINRNYSHLQKINLPKEFKNKVHIAINKYLNPTFAAE